MLERLLNSLLGDRAVRNSAHEVLGIRVLIENTRPDIEARDIIARLETSLGLIQEYMPHHFRHLQRDFNHIIVKRFACRGAYFYRERACLVELTFSVNKEFSDAE